MTIHFDLPDKLTPALASLRDANGEAREVFLVSLYRTGRIDRVKLGSALCLNRFEVDGVLKRHNIVDDLPTAEELALERHLLGRLLGPQ